MTISFPTIRFYKKDILFYLLMGVIALFVYAKGCSNTVPSKEYRLNPRTAARAFAPLSMDTTKPKVINPLYLRKLDTLDLVIQNYLGKSLSVDNSETLKQIFFRITHELRTDTTLRK